MASSDEWLAAALLDADAIVREIRFQANETESPLEKACGWDAYRNAEGLRKALGKWQETRRWKSAHASECNPAHAAKA